MYINVLRLYESKGFGVKSKGSSQKRGEEYAGECPACGGEDRFRIWPEQNDGQGSYHCRKCEMFGDVIQFLRDFEGVGFLEAQKMVTGETNYKPKTHVFVKKQETKNVIEIKEIGETISDLWVTKASAFQKFCTAELEFYPDVIAHLEKRGISLENAKHYGIGYCPGEKGKSSMMRSRKGWGLENILATPHKKEKSVLWLPRGIVVPVLDDGKTKRLRIRRDDEDREEYMPKMKYYVVPGSDMTPLFLPSMQGALPVNYVVLVVEGELDAYMLHAKIGDFCAVLSIMTAKISSVPKHIMNLLKGAAFILVATDVGDKSNAGYEGFLKWQQSFKNAKRFPCVGGKDPGEMVENGLDVRLWTLSALPDVYIKQILSQQIKNKTDIAKEVPYALKNICQLARNEESEKTLAAERRRGKQRYSLEYQYIGPFDYVYILACYGLEVVPTIDDFVIRGHEKWGGKDYMKLFHFIHNHSEQIKNQLRELGQIHVTEEVIEKNMEGIEA